MTGMGELVSPIQEDVANILNLTNARTPFYNLQVEFNEEVLRMSWI